MSMNSGFSAAFDSRAVVPPPVGSCAWPIDPACLTDEWDLIDEEVQTRAVALASATLTRLTGYRVSNCPVTVRPCKRGCTTWLQPAYYDMRGYAAGWWPHIENGVWVNSCGCQTACSCTELCEIELPAPIGRVDQVKLDGQVVDPVNYRVDGNLLVWVGATECPWPTCQEMGLADTEPGTFSITYLNAYPVDALGAYAAGIMAMEFARACTGSKNCRLPPGVTSISRAGVTMEIATGSFPGGVTGIREVDTYIALWNPTPIRQSPQVWSPDLPRAPRVVSGSGTTNN